MELVDTICKFCNIFSLKSLRLVNLTLCVIPEKWLYLEVLLFMHRKSLEHVKCIAKHKRLAGYVRSLCFYGDHGDEMDFDAFKIKWISQCQDEVKLMTFYRSLKLEQRERLTQADQSPDGEDFYNQIRDKYGMVKPMADVSMIPTQKQCSHYQRLAQEGISMELNYSIRRTLVLFFHICRSLSSIEFSLLRDGSIYSRHRKVNYNRLKHNVEFGSGLILPLG